MADSAHSIIAPAGQPGAPLTMSSHEIAKACEARHNDVVATIERLFAKGVLRESRKTTRAHVPVGGGRPTEVYDLTKRDCLVVVSAYDDHVRARVIDRWIELETAAGRAASALEASAARPATVAVATDDLRHLTERIGQLEARLAGLSDGPRPFRRTIGELEQMNERNHYNGFTFAEAAALLNMDQVEFSRRLVPKYCRRISSLVPKDEWLAKNVFWVRIDKEVVLSESGIIHLAQAFGMRTEPIEQAA